MSGDIAFEKELQRTISVDVRYILFIIDKFAGASNIINELTLVKGGGDKTSRRSTGSFSDAFEAARDSGLEFFTWKSKTYTTRLANTE